MPHEAFYLPFEEAARARAAILAAYDAFIKTVRKAGIDPDLVPIGNKAFIRQYNAGEITVESWVRETFPTISLNSLKTWRRRSAAGETLAGKYGQRKSTLAIDPQLQKAFTRVLKKQPGITAPQLIAELKNQGISITVSARSVRRYLQAKRETA